MNVRLLPLTLIAVLSAPAFADYRSVGLDLSVGDYRSVTDTPLGKPSVITLAHEPHVDQCTLRTADSEDRISTKLGEELSATLLPISVSHGKVKVYVEVTRLVISPTDRASVNIADNCSLSLVDSQAITVRRMLELPVGEAYEFKLPNGESVRLSTVVAGKLD